MRLTKQEFDSEARAISIALEILQNNNQETAYDGSTVLDRWKIVLSAEDDVYLNHAFVLQEYHEYTGTDDIGINASNDSLLNSQKISISEGEASEEHGFSDDETIEIDPVAVIRMPEQVYGRLLPSASSSDKSPMTEWTFSIVYSYTWNVPVLYFNVLYHRDRSQCHRTEVLEILKSISRVENGTFDDWDFISQEQHPISGIPMFFLHPCQTSQRLEVMNLQKRDDDMEERKIDGAILLSWMTMTFPAIGCCLPPKIYTSIHKILIEKTNIAADDSCHN